MFGDGGVTLELSGDFHSRVHHSGNVYKCSQCDRIFGRQNALSRHINSDHVVEEYNCDECEQTFKRKDILSRHIESVHCLKFLIRKIKSSDTLDVNS